MQYNYPRSAWIRLTALAALALSSASTLANAQPASPLSPVQQQIVDQVEQFLIEQADPLGGQTAVFVTPPADAPSCEQVDIYLPKGRRLAPKTTVGVRCLGQAGAPVYVRADVKVEATYYVPNQTIGVNRVISSDLLEPVQGDLLSLPRGTLTDEAGLLGRITKQRLIAGRPVRASATRGSDSIERGQSVRIEVRAPGMTITSQGEALSSAEVGSGIQVKTDQGKVIQAVVQAGGVVTISP